MTRDDGFAGLAELSVALLLLGLLLPLVGVGLDNCWHLFSSLTGTAAADSNAMAFLSTAESELQGAQPLGYCATPRAAGSGDPAVQIEVPMSACSTTSLGPPPPDGLDDWSAWVSPLPVPSSSSCGSAELGEGALVTATATCIGFFSYDHEASGSTSAAEGALSDTGPFTPPELDYLWQCVDSCPGAGGAAGLWLTTYAPSGSYTNAGCPSPTSACSDPDWSTATTTRRFVGSLADPSVTLLSYRDTTGDLVAEDGGGAPAALAPSALQRVDLVSIEMDVTSPGGAMSSQATSVALTGNVFDPTTEDNG